VPSADTSQTIPPDEGALWRPVNWNRSTPPDKPERCHATCAERRTEKTTGACEKQGMCAEGEDNIVSDTCKSPCGKTATCSNKTSCGDPDRRSATSQCKNRSCNSRSGASEELSSNARRSDLDGFAGGPNKKIDTGLDIEKGTSLMEHVSLSVGGLTCTGCEMKLYRALHDIPSVCNLHTSLVMSQAEFDLDGQAGPVDELIKAVEKATGFSCQRLSSSGQDLDVIADADAKAFVERKYPPGITLMKRPQSTRDSRDLRSDSHRGTSFPSSCLWK